jgi:hypothetical protein
MKSNLRLKTLLAAVLIALCLPAQAGETDNLTDAIETVRAIYKTDRQAFLAETLQLTEPESKAFWPQYGKYRAEMDKLGDRLVKLVLEYADVYPNVPEDRAKRMLKEYTALEGKMASTRACYFKRAAKSISGAKALRWAQLENRMDLGLRLQLAGVIPLVPAEKSTP